MAENSGPRSVKSAKRVADILFLLGGPPGHAGLAEIAASLAMPKSSAHGLVHTLTQEGILSRKADGDYMLSPRWLAVAADAFDRLDIRQAALLTMVDLSRRLKATCNLGILDGGNIVYVEQVRDGSHPMQLATHVGAAVPAHATALGKVLVAELPEEQRSAWLGRHDFTAVTQRTVSLRAALETAMDAYRMAGYAVDDEELHEGVLCIAAGVCDHRGATVGAVSVTTIKSHFLSGEYTIDSAGAAVRRAADEVSEKLGWFPRS